jgi:hypothetical protein
MAASLEKIQHAVGKESGRVVKRARVSIQDFTRIAFQTGRHRDGVGLSGSISDKSWYGVTSFDEAEAIQKNGYLPEGHAPVIPAQQGEDAMLYMERAVVGQFPDPAAWLRGEPESMYSMVFDPQPTPTIHLACMMNVTGGITGEDQQRHADSVFQVIRGLQNAGNQVTLTALFYNDMLAAGCYEELQVEILREGQVLSNAALGARFHLSFYRVGWFSWAQIHFSNCGGSRTPPAYVDNGTRLVIPSFEFMPKIGVDPKTRLTIRQSVQDFVTEALRKRAAG